jgi:HlyD family secretion protein
VEDQFKRIDVLSPADGVVVFGDINDWLGKPVTTGERVALLADPKDAGVLVWLPVSEAINLEAGAELKLYLQVAPLKPLSAILTQTSYQAVLSPEGISAYRLRAQLKPNNPEEQALARIGLKGTAKIYGQKATLGYYLFRRPLAALRELTGL